MTGEHHGAYLGSADTRDSAWEFAHEAIETMRTLGVMGKLIGIREVKPDLFYIEMFERTAGSPPQRDGGEE